MANFVEFSIRPSKVEMICPSYWEIRNKGIAKIVHAVHRNLQGFLKDEFILRIHTSDTPGPEDQKEANILEFQTVASSLKDENLFPDFTFGNWWHIGLVDYDKFVNDIDNKSQKERIADERIFWKGSNHKNINFDVPQRNLFIKMARSNPEKILGELMTWNHKGPTSFTPMSEKTKYKCLIDLTGIGYSGRLKMLPFCNRPLFITEREYWCWADMMILKQNLHIWVRDDLKDLLEKYDKVCRDYDNFFEQATALKNYCRSHLMFSDACRKATETVKKSILKSKKSKLFL